jgi:hypothetical protein
MEHYLGLRIAQILRFSRDGCFAANVYSKRSPFAQFNCRINVSKFMSGSTSFN